MKYVIFPFLESVLSFWFFFFNVMLKVLELFYEWKCKTFNPMNGIDGSITQVVKALFIFIFLLYILNLMLIKISKALFEWRGALAIIKILSSTLSIKLTKQTNLIIKMTKFLIEIFDDVLFFRLSTIHSFLP